MSKYKRSPCSLVFPTLVMAAVFALAGCGSGNDQPEVEKLTKAQAAKKQVLDDQLRTRQRTTQSDR